MLLTNRSTRENETSGSIWPYAYNINWTPFILAAIVILAVLVGLLGGSGNGRLALVLCAYAGLIGVWGGRPEAMALAWLALSPIASYLLRYPPEQSLLTFDRVVVVVLAVAVAGRVLSEREQKIRFGIFELFWLLFAAYGLADCLGRGAISLASLKIAVDAFFLPLVLFVVARNGLKIDSMKRGIFFALLLLAYGLLPTGLYELLTGVDLLEYPGSDLMRDGLIRPNGPFLSDNSYALISLLVGLALLFWPEAAGLRIKGRQRLLWLGGVASAMLAALVPQFRTVGLVMVLSLGLAYYFRHGLRTLVKPTLVLGLLVLACLPVWLILSRTDFYQRRIADPTNAYNRLATYRVALEITSEGWPRGVGLGRYEERFQSRYPPKQRSGPTPTEELSRMPQSTPHNNLLSIVAELGVVGILFYVLANISVLLIGLKQLKCEGRARAAGAAIITLWTAYTLVGLTLTSGYYSDLNLTFFFLLGILINCTGIEN